MSHSWSRLPAALLVAVLLTASALLAGCSGADTTSSTAPETPEAAEPSGPLVVYSSRNEKFVDPLLEKFSADTGIEVSVLHAGDTVVNKLKEEAGSVQADIIIANDIGALEYLRLEGLLAAPGDVEGIDSIDADYRAADDSWVALSARTRVLMYNKDLITEAEVPNRIEDLADPAYEGMFAITRGGNASMIGHVSALRNEWGDERTEEWIAVVKDNTGAILEGHGDIRRAVGAGEFAFGLVNNYYYHQQLAEPTDNNVGVVYPDQGPGEMGAVINGAGVGTVAGGPNPVAALAFLEWVLLPENQREFSWASLEVPINPEIEAVPDARPISDYVVHAMPLRELGAVWEDTRTLIERAGLDLELK
jgi:iron(III) transport system substrate-binding protein